MEKIPNHVKNVEQEDSIDTGWGVVVNVTGNCLALSSKLNKHLPYNPEIPLFCRDAQEEQGASGCITAKNCSSVVEWMLLMAYSHSRTLHSNENEQSTTAHSNVDEPYIHNTDWRETRKRTKGALPFR